MARSRNISEIELAWRTSDNIVNPLLTSQEDANYLEKFRGDARVFMENYLMIKHDVLGIIPLKLKKGQQVVHGIVQELRAREKPIRLIVLKSRRFGISTYVEALIFWYMRFWKNTQCRIVSHENDSAKDIFDMTALYHRGLPDNLRPPLARNTIDLFIMGNKDPETNIYHPGLQSRMQIGTAKNLSIGRGSGYRCVHTTEVASWKSSDTARALMQCVPSKPDTVAVMESTSEGAQGFFYEEYMRIMDEWRDMKWDAQWIPIFLPSWLDENCTKPLTPQEEADVVCSMDEYEHDLKNKYKNITYNFIAWRRETISEKCKGSPTVFNMEFPICLTGDTRVSTELGLIPVREAGIAKLSESGSIEKWKEFKAAPIWAMETHDGRKISGTYNHPVKLVGDGWRYLSELLPGDRVVLQPPMFATNIYTKTWETLPTWTNLITIDEEAALLLGYYMGDGNWHKGTFSIACDGNDQDVVEEVAKLNLQVFGKSSHYQKVGKIQGRKGCTIVKCYGKEIENFLRQLGIVDYYDSCNNLHKVYKVPECILRSPKEIVAKFLASLYESDGTLSKKGLVSFATKSLDFARDVQLLLLGFGITGKIINTNKIAGNRKVYINYQLWLGRKSSDLFNEVIGFRGARKRGKAYGEFKDGRGRSCGPIVMEDTVEKVWFTGVEDKVYDFTIKEVHQFSANGILTHNTTEAAFSASGQTLFDKTSLTWYKENTVKRGVTGRLIIPEGMITRPYFVEEDNGPLTIYQFPEPGKRYAIGADGALGKAAERGASQEEIEKEAGDKDNDYCSAEVCSSALEQCAEYNSRVIAAYDFADEVANLGWYYNTAFIMPETGNQSAGYAIQKRLKELKYPRIGRWEKIDSTTLKKYTESLGYEVNYKSKSDLVAMLQREIMRGAGRLDYRTIRDERDKPQMKLRSIELLRQLQVFAYLSGGSVGAKKGTHDDLVIALCMCLKAIEQMGEDVEKDNLLLAEKIREQVYPEEGSDSSISFWEM